MSMELLFSCRQRNEPGSAFSLFPSILKDGSAFSPTSCRSIHHAIFLANFLRLLTFSVVYSVAFPWGAAFTLCPERTPIGKIRKQCFLELAPLVGSSRSVVFEVPTGSGGGIECPS